MKSQKFFFSVVAVAVVLGVFFFVFFGIVKPRFQSAVREVGGVQVAVVRAVNAVAVADAVNGNEVAAVAKHVVVIPVVLDNVVEVNVAV
jgi:hypothetical protein